MKSKDIHFHVREVLAHLNEHEVQDEMFEHLKELHKLEPSFFGNETFPYYPFEDVVHEVKFQDALASTEIKMKKQLLHYVHQDKQLFLQQLQNLLTSSSLKDSST